MKARMAAYLDHGKPILKLTQAVDLHGIERH